nr:MAG TPA: hypothetical protein [Caudoviricetes sp.]
MILDKKTSPLDWLRYVTSCLFLISRSCKVFVSNSYFFL